MQSYWKTYELIKSRNESQLLLLTPILETLLLARISPLRLQPIRLSSVTGLSTETLRVRIFVQLSAASLFPPDKELLYGCLRI